MPSTNKFEATALEAGDFIVFDAMGAYTVAVRTTFNGFWNDTWIEVDG